MTTVRFSSTRAHKWTWRLLSHNQYLAKFTAALNTLHFLVSSKSSYQNLVPLSLNVLFIYAKNWQNQQGDIELTWVNPNLSSAAALLSFHIKYSWACRQSQPQITTRALVHTAKPLTQMHPARLRNVRPQRNTGRLSMPAAQLTQQPLSESSRCQMLQTTPVLRITHVQENPPVRQGPGSQWHPAETFLQNREVSCRAGYKAKKHRLTADPRRAEKSFRICSI